MRMSDKAVAVVTGGGSGIGAACVRALASEGFRVGVHYRSNRTGAEALLGEIGDGLLLYGDLAKTEDTEALIQQVKSEAGRLDVLVNNAGLTVNVDMQSMKIDDFDRQRSLLRGTWYLTKRVLRMFMLRQGSGRIINISSVVGSIGNAGQMPYTMEKAALDAMTKSLSRELAGRDILVNSVAPGFVDTDMTANLPEAVRMRILADVPLGRMGRPEEVAEVVAFLATKGSYITGSVIHVNGGLYGG